MAEESPSKNDINAIFKRLRGISTNKSCFDCTAKNPTWASVTYGVFICIDCSAIHRSLGVHVTFVKSTQLDTNWTWLQVRGMQVGGNANAEMFFRQHNCTTSDGQQKYTSRAAQLYREKLHQQAAQAMRLHGTKVFLDADHVERPQSPNQKDFFDETEIMMLTARMNVHPDDGIVPPRSVGNGTVTSPDQDLEGPSVDAVLGTSPTEAIKVSETRKPTIGQRKAPAAKKGFGAKKGGLGAQKVRTNFSELEKEAEMQDRLREEAAAEEKIRVQRSQEDEAKQMASIRLAYQDLGMKKQKEEDKMKQVDPKKAAQMERLGMGYGSRSTGVAHSAAGDMKTIEQDSPKSTGSSTVYKDARDFFEDDFEIISYSSGPPKYRDSPFSSGDRYSKPEDRFSSKKPSSWDTEKPESKSSFFDEMIISKESDDSTRRKPSLPTPTSSTEAVKKFGNAKSISSEQYFGNSSDMDYERRANLSRFEGSASISSADYFGDGNSSNRNQPQPSFNAPDLEDIREGVRAGVTKVAGKLSNIANGVMTSLQDRYGY